MRELTFEEFELLWPSYWGRRELGIVIDDTVAARIFLPGPSLLTFYEQWLVARAAFPKQTSLWLLGTPDLSPRLLTEPVSPPGDSPPLPRVGRYATDTPSPSGLSPLAGDHDSSSPLTPHYKRVIRRVNLGWLGILFSTGSLFFLHSIVLAAPAAVLGLVLCFRAARQLSRFGVSFRIRWPFLAAQMVAVIALILAIMFCVMRQLPQLQIKHEEYQIAMTDPAHPTDEPTDLTTAIVTRLHVHWPQGHWSGEPSPDDPAIPLFIRAKLTPSVILEAAPGPVNWVARPLIETNGEFIPLEENHPYAFGARTTDGPEAIADRFYQEVLFWWAKLHRVIT